MKARRTAVNRDAKTQSSLIALARTRRTQRALAHAVLHRNATMPNLRGTLGFVTSTACVADELEATTGNRMTIVGVAAAEGVAYVVEELSEDVAPIVYRLWLAGPRHGHLVPIHAWYEVPASAAEIRARLAAIATTLEPVTRSTTEAWMLSTRVVQRRALRVAPGPTLAAGSIRKFALQLAVEPVSGHGPSGKTTVTAFLRPNASLTDVWALPGGDAIARVTYTGIPNGLGLSRDTVVLLTDRLA
jgi:hypothetical protein